MLKFIGIFLKFSLHFNAQLVNFVSHQTSQFNLLWICDHIHLMESYGMQQEVKTFLHSWIFSLCVLLSSPMCSRQSGDGWGETADRRCEWFPVNCPVPPRCMIELEVFWISGQSSESLLLTAGCPILTAGLQALQHPQFVCMVWSCSGAAQWPRSPEVSCGNVFLPDAVALKSKEGQFFIIFKRW